MRMAASAGPTVANVIAKVIANVIADAVAEIMAAPRRKAANRMMVRPSRPRGDASL
jgi:hypothetical protein